MVLAVTVRTPDVDARPAATACLAGAGRARTARRIELGGLGVDDVETWIGDRRRELPARAVGRLVHDRTGGHPFFVRELLALLAGDGDGGVELDERAVLATAVPAAVHDVVRRRVSLLPAPTQQLMTAAAVLGRRVDLGVLAGVVEEPIDVVLASLEPALAAGLLEPDPDRVGQLLFAHALVADALRAEQTAAGLARRHAVVTTVIERRWAGDLDAVIDELAIHAHAGAAAGTAAAAVEHGARAAELATAASAPADAAAHLRRALDALTVAAPGDRVRRQQLSTELGIALAASGDAMGGRAALVQAAALADALGDVDGVVRALRHVNGDDLWSSLDWSQSDASTMAVIERNLDRLPADRSASRAELTAALAAELYSVDAARSLALAAEAVDLAALVGDPLVEARVLLRQCWAAWRPAGQPLRAAAGDRLVELASSGRLPERFRPLAHLTRFVAAYEIGDAADGRSSRRPGPLDGRPGADPGRVDLPPLRRVVAARRPRAPGRGARSGRRRPRSDAPLPPDRRRRHPGRPADPGLASSWGAPTTRSPRSTTSRRRRTPRPGTGGGRGCWPAADGPMTSAPSCGRSTVRWPTTGTAPRCCAPRSTPQRSSATSSSWAGGSTSCDRCRTTWPWPGRAGSCSVPSPSPWPGRTWSSATRRRPAGRSRRPT